MYEIPGELFSRLVIMFKIFVPLLFYAWYNLWHIITF